MNTDEQRAREIVVEHINKWCVGGIPEPTKLVCSIIKALAAQREAAAQIADKLAHKYGDTVAAAIRAGNREDKP